jgi:hypothetical protein
MTIQSTVPTPVIDTPLVDSTIDDALSHCKVARKLILEANESLSLPAPRVALSDERITEAIPEIMRGQLELIHPSQPDHIEAIAALGASLLALQKAGECLADLEKKTVYNAMRHLVAVLQHLDKVIAYLDKCQYSVRQLRIPGT